MWNKWSNIFSRMAAVVFGLLAVAVLLEGALFSVGRVWSLKLAARDGAVALRRGSFRVLCIGDSYTYGQGAPKGKDYPSQLLSMLAGSGINAEVINRGRPGANTRVVLERLERDLQETKPSVVCVLAGRANDWNSYGLENLNSELKQPWWLALKTFTLVRLLYFNVVSPWQIEKQNTPVPGTSSDQGSDYYKHKPRGQGVQIYESAIESFYRREFDSAYKGFLQLCRMYPDAFEYYQLASQSLIAAGLNNEAVEFLESSLKQAPGVGQLYEYLAKEYIEAGRDSEAVDVAIASVRHAPDTPLFFDVVFYVFQYANVPDAKERILKALFVLNTKTSESFYQRLKTFQKNDLRENVIRRWVMSDLRKIIRLCRKYNAVVLLCSYPQDRFMSSQFRNLARSGGHMFCEHYRIFSSLPVSEREKYFAIDGHCNGLGYRLMAQNIFETLFAAGLCQPAKDTARQKGNQK